MIRSDIPRYRLHHQGLSQNRFTTPSAVVAWLGGLQAQDYAGVKWSIGMRLPAATDRAIEQAFAERTIIRTWPMRGTLHVVAAADIHWLLPLVTPRIVAGNARRYRELELDAATFTRSKKVLIQALQGGQVRTRDDLKDALEQAGIAPTGQRAYHLLQRAGMDGLICFGPPRGKQHTFVLLDEWIPTGTSLAHDEALAELAKRYFTSRGPATLHDFVWWSGLRVSEARTGLAAAAAHLIQETIDGTTYWMPPTRPIPDEPSLTAYLPQGFDEYILGYTDRSAVLDARYDKQLVGRNGMFSRTIVIDGQVVGTWKRAFKKDAVVLSIDSFDTLSTAEEDAIAEASTRYGAFQERPVVLA